MKKTSFLLFAVTLSLCALPLHAADTVLRVQGQPQSPTVGTVIAAGATLINTETGGKVIYDINDDTPDNPPFDITKGKIYRTYDLLDKYNGEISLDDVTIGPDGDSLILDFTTYNLGAGYYRPTGAEYYVFMFTGDFATWYEENPVTITGKFHDGNETAYVVDYACDMYVDGNPTMRDPGSSYGGIVFFDDSVADAVLADEVDPNAPVPEPEPEPSTPTIPEPTTATLSLLALAGLAARRRRK